MRTICLWRRRKVLTSPRTQAQDSCECIDLFAVVPRFTLKRFIERIGGHAVFELQVQQIESAITVANVGALSSFLTGLHVVGRVALVSWLFIWDR